MKKSSLLLFILFLSTLSIAQNDGFKPVQSLEDYQGVWITADSADVRLLEDEYAPGGAWFVIYDAESYFSAYLDPEMGASIDVGFDYTLDANTFNCKLTYSNSIGYYMENENQPFSFKLYYKTVNNESFLRLVNNFGTTYDMVKFTLD